MIENIYLGVQVVFPLLVFMVIGYLLRRLKWVTEKGFSEINKLVFRILMPIMLFLNANMSDIREVFNAQNVQVLMITIVCVLLTLFISLYIGTKKVPDMGRRAVIVQGIYRSNLILFGLPVSVTIYGEGRLGTVAVLIIVAVPLYNIIAAILLDKVTDNKMDFWKALKSAFTNYLVIGSILGVLFNLLGGQIPQMVQTPMEQLGRMGTPLAFIVLGGSMVFGRMRDEIRTISLVSSLRLVLIPIIVFIVAMFFGLQGPPLVALLVVFAAPTAITSYTMAKEANIEVALAGDFVAVTTILSVVTMILWITFLGSMNLLF